MQQAAQATTFSITDTKIYVPVVTLSTHNVMKNCWNNYNLVLEEQLTYKYQPNVSTERINQYLDFLIDPGFQGVYRLFAVSFENEAQRTSYKQYYLPALGCKNKKWYWHWCWHWWTKSFWSISKK